MCVNCPPGLSSDVGAYLSENNPCGVAVMFYLTERGTNYSLRVAANSDYDAATYAKRYGGGGHQRAAGYKIAR